MTAVIGSAVVPTLIALEPEVLEAEAVAGEES